jgi:tetratricopeptide (TPR) repeat protein
MPKKIKKTKSSVKKKQAGADIPNIVQFPRREAMEGTMASIFGGGKGRAVDEAQDIMYDAWEAPTSEHAIDLAKKALTISPDCADAYVFLAQETAKSLDEAIDLYRQGVEAGERALGKKAFKDDIGHFWGILETRPYMRARAGLAECLWDVGKREEAVEHYQDMLRLNPGDNQGIRDILMPRLIELGRDEDAEELFAHYNDDGSAFWMYSRVLLDFRKQGDSPVVSQSLKAALKGSKHVPVYLLGRKKMPRSLPPHYSFGSEDEATIYVDDNKPAWKATPGALKWLAERSEKD